MYLGLKQKKKEIEMSEDNLSENDYLAEMSENNEQFDENGICIFCDKHKDKAPHYKCWIK